jgi:hypothetical protein
MNTFESNLLCITRSLAATIVLTWIVNVILFLRLVKSDVLRRHRSPRFRDATTNHPTSFQTVTASDKIIGDTNGHMVQAGESQNNNVGVGGNFKPKRL